jgi:CheY-like chemotaxis protein
MEVQTLARRTQIDLILLDNTMGGHWGKDMMKALHAHRLLLDTPVILMVECRNDQARAVAEALDAVHIHERRDAYDDLQPFLHSLLLS